MIVALSAQDPISRDGTAIVLRGQVAEQTSNASPVTLCTTGSSQMENQ